MERQVAWLAEQQALSTYDDEHDPEGLTVALQRAQLQGLLAGARLDLASLDRAAQRLVTSSTGRARGCGRDIGAVAVRRLE